MTTTGRWEGGWTDYIFAGGKRIAKAPGVSATTGTEFYHADHLGSARLMTNYSGTVVANSEGTFLPYGEEFSTTTSGNHYKFTGKERDIESGLDYFGARYYGSQMGRFLTPDPSMESAVLRDPQSWNRYGYVLNNPLGFIDPDGELWVSTGNASNPYSWVEQCGNGQTCYAAVAANVSGSLRVYGSYNANDVTNYAANPFGVVDMRAVSQHHDAQFVSRQTPGQEENYLGAKQGAALFNVSEAYHQAYSNDSKLVFTGGSAANGLPAVNPRTGEPLHSSHHSGLNVDLKYMSPAGTDTNSAGADVGRTLFLLNAFANQHAGLDAALTGTPARFGLNHHSLEAMHMSHMHFQKNYPPSPKKGQ